VGGVEGLRELWRAGKVVNAAWCLTADGLIAETLAHAGFDSIVLDLQHGMAIGPDRAASWLQATASSSVPTLVRVPWNEPVHMQYVLDAGADGVIVPMVNTPEEAARAAKACRYGPNGIRSFGPNRARFRAGATSDLVRGNEQVVCLVMIEHVDGLKNVEAIVNTPGVDGVFVGWADLALSMGLDLTNRDASFLESMFRIAKVARTAGKVAGIPTPGGISEIPMYVSHGFNFTPICTDSVLVRLGAATALQQFGQVSQPTAAAVR